MARRGSFRDVRILPERHHSRIQRNQPLRRGQQRIDIDFLDPALLGDQAAEPHQQLFQRGQVLTGFRPRTPCRALKILVCSIKRRASVVLSGGSDSARSLKTSTNCPPVPNSSTGPNCAVNAAAEDQLIALRQDHGLHGDAREMLGRRPFLPPRPESRRKAFPDRALVDQIQLARRPRRSCA